MQKERHGFTRAALFLLLCLHQPLAIGALDMHDFGGPDACPATRALVFDAVTVGVSRSGSGCRSGAAPARPRACAAPLQTVDLDILPALLNDEIQKGLGGLGDAPSNALVVADGKVSRLSSGLKPFIVIFPAAAAAILNALLHIVEMHTFMQHCGNHIFNGSVERSRADVQLVPVFLAPPPCLANRDMTIRAGG